MAYLVTGATGFIGRHLVPLLLARGGPVFALVRAGSRGRLDALRDRLGVDAKQLVAIEGDLEAPRLGVSDADVERLRGVEHAFHLAALYDMEASNADLARANVEGTRNLIALLDAIEVGRLHHVSSIAAAGRFEGVFEESMFHEATGLDDPYFRTKHDSEALVRAWGGAWRVYRPGVVIGHSETGEIDKIDGPYYFFKLIQRLRGMLPAWFPLVGLEGGPANLVPVDFVARALDHIAHQPDLDGSTFHLVDPDPPRLGEAMNSFARAAHAPEFALRVEAHALNVVPRPLRHALASFAPVKRITDQVLADLGIPRRVLAYVDAPTRFDAQATQRALAGTDIQVPPLDSYAWRLWDYWERHLDPDLDRERTLASAVAGRRVLITGASAGIGRAAALQIAEAGGIVLLVARSADKLAETRLAIQAAGGTAHIHTADIADLESCDALVAEVTRDHGGVDILVNNAGRSIRRSLALSYDRFHDFERTMQLNYFGALKLIMGLVPGMRERKHGHVVNVSSIGVQTNTPRFSAYVASKAALDAFSRCAASELVDDGVAITTVYMPLVRTEMIAPTKIYDAFPTITADEAGQMICTAIVDRPKRVATRLGIFGEVAYAAAPKAVDVLLNTAYRLFPDSSAARGKHDPATKDEVSSEALAFAHLIPGVHW